MSNAFTLPAKAIAIRQPKIKPMTAQERTAAVLRVNPVSGLGVNDKDQWHTTQRISQASI